MAKTALHLYALALGSNRALSARLTPRQLLEEATKRIALHAQIVATSPAIETPPIGPSRRRYANAAILVQSPLEPPAMLAWLQSIEQALGRRRYRRWGARRVDIDIILWSGGVWNSPMLTIPHPAFAARDFVLTPLRAIAPAWRDPRSGLTIRHLQARLQKAQQTMPQEVDHPRRPL
ncbi:2-amino-4-hydroxy-6-hydroxymethyldihydropteridine diphosphokinase [Sphingobium sp. AS12]|uniref:2-amino-4-hydroxy-6- hydroxymethyldihydropteridine diphosphokinase n=1 Tax=Sphingobium sp. AS12 TaxID=2849495 RepID=UPI001C31B946|nr:2-amino-4-hydroxy-6-hydroxymethyldihydropteridine diphosphokinase [Sphingobium sp. AS12]MBV2147203.1 2-amino-4-hydroxy-6-hydroxymethyldihydropteridine diphosphokinase [Sphingobium sp. AS12]